MKHPEEICAELVALLTTDTFGFSYGAPPDQNFDADEYTYPHVFLDKPIRAKVFNSKSGTRELTVTMQLFFAYKTEMDEPEGAKFDNVKVVAWNSAREFVLRLRKYDDYIKDVVDEQLTDVDHVFDINLSGVLLEVTVVIIDAGGICLT
jgi:hypothetical protein